MDTDEDIGAVGTDHQTDTTESPAADGEVSDLQRVRDLILQAHPDVVPELVTGTSIDALLGSVAPARDAFSRVSERLGSTQPRVPAGGPVRTAGVNAEHLSPVSKIRLGLSRD